MNPEDIDIDPNAPYDPKVISDVKQGIRDMSRDLVSGKIAESKLLQQAMEEVGIGSQQEAILNLMDYLNIGVRALSTKLGIPRRKLANMLNGVAPMPPETYNAMVSHFKDVSAKQKKNLSFDF